MSSGTGRRRLLVDESAGRLHRYLEATTELMQILARACGHAGLAGFDIDDLSTWNRDVAALTGVRYAGVS